MVHRPRSIILAAGFAAFAFSQTNPSAVSNAMLDGTRTSSPQVTDSPKPPSLTAASFVRNQLDLALTEFRTALTLDPEVFEHHSSYGVMLQERSVQDRAKYHYWMATLYASQNRGDLAIQYLRKALEEGFKERKKLVEEPAFAAIRELPEFKQLLTLEPRVL